MYAQLTTPGQMRTAPAAPTILQMPMDAARVTPAPTIKLLTVMGMFVPHSIAVRQKEMVDLTQTTMGIHATVSTLAASTTTWVDSALTMTTAQMDGQQTLQAPAVPVQLTSMAAAQIMTTAPIITRTTAMVLAPSTTLVWR